jgi:hypothetical protein
MPEKDYITHKDFSDFKSEMKKDRHDFAEDM